MNRCSDDLKRERSVSVIMVMRDAGATVWQAIRSLQLQTLTNWELILVDDGSCDNSLQIADSFADPRIRIIADGKKQNLACRLNQAVALAGARFIARMDADDICFPDRLRKQVDFLGAYPDVDIVGCGAAVFSDDGLLRGLLPVPSEHSEIIRAPWRGFPLPHPTWCGRREWFQKNPYDPVLMRAQDQDLLLRSHARSRFAALSDVLLAYRQSRLDLNKILKGRYIYSRSLWVHGRSQLPFQAVIRGVLSQGAKGIADVAMLALGLNRFAQLQRLDEIPRQVGEKWSELWCAIQAPNSIELTTRSRQPPSLTTS